MKTVLVEQFQSWCIRPDHRRKTTSGYFTGCSFRESGLKRATSVHRSRQSGQTTIFVILVLGLFLLAAVGLAIDYSSVWFHRQAAQAAADAACEAGVMDMLVIANGTTAPAPGFTVGTAFNCSGSPSATPCQYASRNGYNGSTGLQTGSESVGVSVSFPTSVTGVTIPPGLTALAGANPFMRVDVTDRTRMYFSSLLTASTVQDVKAHATCGLQLALAPIPIIVLHPTKAGSFNIGGTPDIIITGGPSRSIQVNSSSTSAISKPFGDAKVDLSLGGPDGTGSDFGVFGLNTPPCTSPCKNLNLGSTGDWNTPATPIGDPFALVPEPAVPTGAAPPATDVVTYGTTATATTDPYCPPGNNCERLYPGNYPSGIQVKKGGGGYGAGSGIALFVEGVYYLGGDLNLASNSLARPSAWHAPTAANQIGGTMFFFSGTSGMSVAANSGSPTTLFPSSAVQCPGGAPVTISGTLDGNVFLGPCTGTYGDPLGQYRGMLFFHQRSSTGILDLSGGGGMLVVGNLYFHRTSTYASQITLGGNSASGTRILGSIVTDTLNMNGTSAINMQLNPEAAYSILKATLLE